MKNSSMENKAIIICAGEATRWGNYLNTPKHLIEIEGEKLLHRTVRLLKERGIYDISIVVKEISDDYEAGGAKQYKANLNPEENADADKFLSSEELWNKEGRTLVFYGDCYFTDEAMNTIVGFEGKEWTLFCRPNESTITGTPYGECFAQSFYPEDHEKHKQALHYTAKLFKDGIILRCGGWEHYRVMTGKKDKEVEEHTMTTNFIEIDDFTDDFDYPSDYDNWIEHRKS